MCKVAWYGHSRDIQRSAKSFLFAGKNKTLKIKGGAYEVLFYFRVTFDARDTDLLSRMHSIVLS